MRLTTKCPYINLNISSLTKSALATVAMIAIVLMSGCSSSPEPKFMSVEGRITATTVLNPDIKGGYRPVNLKVFYLKSDEGFADASFSDLYRYPDKVLSSSILHISSHQLLPGQEVKLQEDVPRGLKYIGVAAAFRNLEESEWKDIQAVPGKCFTCSGVGLWDPVEIHLDRLAVTIDTGLEPDEKKKNNKKGKNSDDDPRW